MTRERKTFFERVSLVAALALALPLFAAGTASAVHIGDGSKPNGTTGGWDITDYGDCFSGIRSDGTIVIDTAHNLSRPDCIDHVLGVDSVANPTIPTDSDYDTQAECLATSGRVNNPTDNVSHYWTTNVCVNPTTGAGINLDGLDRTATNCTLKGGVRVTACTGSWAYRGPAEDGAPGFCYTTINLTTAYGTQALCPTTINGFSWTSSQCRYSYGIAGYLTGAITKKDGSPGNAIGDFVTLSGYTQGQCLWNGFSWSTGTTKATPDIAEATTPNASTRGDVRTSRAGCLECHNQVSQYNTYAERWKEPYLMTGHKNMLRKVTAGEIWAGPDGVSYQTTGWALGTIDFTATPPTATNPSVPWTYPLLYVFGDWMAPAPDALDVIVAIDATTARYNGTNTYSCASCHATGWSNPSAGICVQGAVAKPTSGTGAVTTEAACLALVPAGVWYPMTGVEGAIASYFTTGAKEPGASFPSMAQPNGTINGITGKWDRDGIMCSRCHYTVFAKNGTNAPGTAFTAPAGTGTHNVTPATTANQQVTGICFGCHQSIGKVSNGTGTDTDLGNPALNITVTNRLTAPAYQPDFSSHPIANQFLNSPHAEYTVPVGSNGIVPNNLGKFNLVGNLETQYASAFKGFVCRSSATAGGGSILATVWKGGAVEEIKTQDDCNLANGQPAGTVGYWQTENRGACTTCHDVHQSLFDPAATEAVRKECETCHTDNTGTGGAGYNAAGVPQINPALVNHLKGAGTPWDTTEYKEPCEACHMPKASAAGFPIHLWRINSDPSYSTFPSAADFIGNVKKNGNVDVNGKMWVDIDLACGKCHGGGTVQDAQHQPKVALCTAPGVPEACCSGPGSGTCAQYRTKLELAGVAEGIHDSAAASYQVTFTASVTDLTVNVDATVNCGGTCPTLTYEWAWGDGTTGTGDPASRTYAGPGKYSIALSVKEGGLLVGSAIRSVTVSASYTTSFAITTYPNPSLQVDVDATVDCGGACPTLTYDWNWGDGTANGTADPDTHTYSTSGTKSITLTVKSNGVTVGTAARNVKVPVAPVDNPPVANATCTWDANKWELRVVDTSTDTDASPVATVVVDWNDLTSRSVGGPGLDVTHTYLKPGTAPGYTATLKAIDSALKMSSPPYSCAPVNPAYFTISGKVVRSDGTTPVASANVQVKRGTTVVKTVPTMGNGTFTAGSLKPGNYTLVVNKLGYTFTVPAAGPFDIGPDQAGLVIQATAP